jgi:hypothetical protein
VRKEQIETSARAGCMLSPRAVAHIPFDDEVSMIDTKLADEAARLAALRRYEILDTLPEAPFDRITGLVKAVFEVPIALVSLIDADRQWLKSCVGMDVSETPREISFCTHTIQRREPMVIANATEDPRFANNPLVTGPPYIASYLGAPLETPDGYNVGSLCAIDTKPRTFSATQIEVMKSFAADRTGGLPDRSGDAPQVLPGAGEGDLTVQAAWTRQRSADPRYRSLQAG